MKNTSVGNLINLIELNHILRNADDVFWTTTGKYEVISDKYMVTKFEMPINQDIYDTSTQKVIAKRFNGRVPEAGQVLHSVKARKRFDVSESHNYNDLMKFLNTQGEYMTVDTGMTIDWGDPREGLQVHAFGVYKASHVGPVEYTFINQKYRELIVEPEYTIVPELKRTSPVIFEECPNDERVVVLPVNITNLPPFVKPLN